MGHPVDVHVGGRVRYRRWMLGMSQQALAAELGVTFQQVQKYEIGSNRISASRLWTIARLLGVPVEFFFEGLLPGPVTAAGTARAVAGGPGCEAAGSESDDVDAVGAGSVAPGPAGVGAGPVGQAAATLVQQDAPPFPGVASLALDRDAATLLRSFSAIPAAKRRRLLDLARALSEPQDGASPG